MAAAVGLAGREVAEARRVREEADASIQRLLNAAAERRSADSIRSAEGARWFIFESSHPITDAKMVAARLYAKEGEGIHGGSPAFTLRCQGARLESWVSWDSFVGNNGAVVTSRLDQAEPVSFPWRPSRDGVATFYPRNANVFLKTLQGAEQVVMRVTPYDDNPVTATFDLSQLQSVIDAMPDCPPQETPPPPSPPPERASVPYMGNRSTDTFHRTDDYLSCWRKIPTSDRVPFAAYWNATSAGYRIGAEMC
jgi:hypothetical protein